MSVLEQFIGTACIINYIKQAKEEENKKKKVVLRKRKEGRERGEYTTRTLDLNSSVNDFGEGKAWKMKYWGVNRLYLCFCKGLKHVEDMHS